MCVLIVKETKKRKRLRTEDEHAVCGANDDSVVTRSSRAPGVLFYLEKETREIHTGKGRHPFFLYITFFFTSLFWCCLLSKQEETIRREGFGWRSYRQMKHVCIHGSWFMSGIGYWCDRLLHDLRIKKRRRKKSASSLHFVSSEQRPCEGAGRTGVALQIQRAERTGSYD